MAKAEKERSKEQPATTAPAIVPEVFQSVMDDASRRTGHGQLYTAGEHGQYYWGIPIWPLVLQYVFGGIDILTYGQFVEISGVYSSFKSSFSIDLLRQAADAGGIGVLFEVESKLGPGLVTGIAPEYANTSQLQVFSGLSSINSWIEATASYLAAVKANIPDGNYPIVLLVDSLTGRSSEEEIEAFQKEGDIKSRSFPVGALTITNFMRSFPSLMMRPDGVHWPIAFLATNHLKEKINQMTMATQYHTPGGRGKDFQAAMMLRMRETARMKLSSATVSEHLPQRLRNRGVELFGECERRTIEISAHKTSLGPNRRSVIIDYFWGWDRNQNQYMWFDYDGALAHLLSSDDGEGESVKEGVRDIVRVTRDGRYFSVSVGRDVRVSRCSSTKAGEAIAADQEVMNQLRNYYHIVQCRKHVAPASVYDVFNDLLKRPRK